jgi:hypothetical protein
MRIIICILLLLFSINLFSQTSDSTDFKVFIQRIINDTSSYLYYPKLQEKIKNHPSEINTEDCFYLYYGQIFQENYQPLSFVANPERLNFDRAVMNGNCKKVLGLGQTILERNPFDLTVLVHVCHCINEKNILDTSFYYQQRFQQVLDAILSTGDGKSKKTAIKIVNMEDDYIIKGRLGFLGGEEKLGFENHHAYSIWEKNGTKLYLEDVMTEK